MPIFKKKVKEETIAEPVETPQAPEPPQKEEIKEVELPTLVVKELPTQEVKAGVDKEGNEYQLVTSDEALTEILEKIRKIYSTLE